VGGPLEGSARARETWPLFYLSTFICHALKTFLLLEMACCVPSKRAITIGGMTPFRPTEEDEQSREIDVPPEKH